MGAQRSCASNQEVSSFWTGYFYDSKENSFWFGIMGEYFYIIFEPENWFSTKSEL